MSKFLLTLLLQISKALVNSKIQFLIRKFVSLLSAWPTPRPVRPQSQPAHLARASVASSRKIHFPFRITPSRAARLFLVSLSIGPHLSDSPPSMRRPTPVRNPSCRHSPAPLPRASDAPELLQPSLITLPPP
jgi:hypothetical protein